MPEFQFNPLALQFATGCSGSVISVSKTFFKIYNAELNGSIASLYLVVKKPKNVIDALNEYEKSLKNKKH